MMGNRQQPFEPQGTPMQVTPSFPRKKPATLEEAKNYWQSALSSCERYPSVTDYERGFEGALRDIGADLGWLPADAQTPAGGLKAPQDS